MEITKKELEDRIAGLKQHADKALADHYAFNGAIQDCEYWLAKLEASEKAAKAVKEDAPLALVTT